MLNTALILSHEMAPQAQSQVIANMRHELRTPLNAIIGYAELLIEMAETPDQQKFVPDLQHILAAARQLSVLINEIVDFPKTDEPEVRPSIAAPFPQTPSAVPFPLESWSVPANQSELFPPPPDELWRGYGLARLGDMDGLIEWINLVDAGDERYHPFCELVRGFAEEFEDRQVLALLERFLTQEAQHGHQ